MSASLWSLLFWREDALTRSGGASLLTKAPFSLARQSTFGRHCSEVLSSHVCASRTVTGIHRSERRPLLEAVWQTVTILVILASRLKTDGPLSLARKIFQRSLLRKTFTVRVKSTHASSPMEKNHACLQLHNVFTDVNGFVSEKSYILQVNFFNCFRYLWH